ncbi:MAG: hypothetical protein AAF800_09380 [Planctomycetota bacterium]
MRRILFLPLGAAVSLCLTLAPGCETSPAPPAATPPPQQPAGPAATRPDPDEDDAETSAPGGTPQVVDTTAPGPPPPGGQAQTGTFTPEQMRDAVRNFADQYRQTIAAACDRIVIEADDDPDLRRRAQQTKIDGATAMYDIAVDPVPASAMLNAAVLVSIQANFLEAKGADVFGDYTPMLVSRAQFLQEEVFRICARAMSDQQRIDLLAMIKQWCEQNPDVQDFWYVRLADLPGVSEQMSVGGMIDGLTDLPGNFLNVFNPFSKGQESVSEFQVLGERMSWLGPRLMILAQWRAEAVVYDSIANTRLPEALELGDRFATVAEDLPATIDDQRTKLFADLEANRDTLNNLLGNSQELTTEANALLQTVDAIAERVGTMQERAIAAAEKRPPPDPDAPPGRPFDITEYTAALVELQRVVADANGLLTNAESATAAEAIDARLTTLGDAAGRVIWTAAAAAVVAGVLLILAVKFIPSRRRG